RLNVAASNLANADSVTGPDGQPYRAKQVVFQVDAAPGQATGGGNNQESLCVIAALKRCTANGSHEYRLPVLSVNEIRLFFVA
ncbi:flagellar basal body protein, partial [Salmonella enterica subsp. enterica serovar Cerro]|nr:flagellar basal body protein [Salmonella enterica subsp. enterica serovar Cerro]